MIFDIFPIQVQNNNQHITTSYGCSTTPLPRVCVDKDEMRKDFYLSLDLNYKIKKLEEEIKYLKSFESEK